MDDFLSMVRVGAYAVSGVAFAHLLVDDLMLQRRRSVVWGVLLLERFVVLSLLALDVRGAAVGTWGLWERWRWVLTPTSVALALAAGVYAIERQRIRWRVISRLDRDDRDGGGG